jgi:hypothetical protein
MSLDVTPLATLAILISITAAILNVASVLSEGMTNTAPS